MDGKLHYSLREERFPKAMFAGEAVRDQGSALTSHSDRRGTILGPLPSER